MKHRYYCYKAGASCGLQVKSIRSDVIEDQLRCIISGLMINPELIDVMHDYAIKMNSIGQESYDLEKEKAKAIALCNRKISAAIDLYREGRITKEDYHRRIEENEHEIAVWTARTTEVEKLTIEFTLCMNAISRIQDLWDTASDEDRQHMVVELFDHIVFDLDKQQIVDFSLEAWAEQFVVARAGVLKDLAEASADCSGAEQAGESKEQT